MIPVHSSQLARAVAKRRWLRRIKLFSLPDLIPIEESGGKLFCSGKDWRGPSFHALRWGAADYERANRNFISSYLAAQSEPVYFDVGANIGIFPYFLSRDIPDLQVFAFEPEPNAYACLKSTFQAAENSRVEALNIALSDHEGTQNLFIDPLNHGGHSLHQEAVQPEAALVKNSVSVATTTLDDFVENQKVSHIDVIKVDIQEHEASFLRGASRSLEAFRPLVLMECYFKSILASDSELLAPFKQNAYVAYVPMLEREIALDSESIEKLRSESGDYIDVAFIPSEKAHQANLRSQ